MKKINLILIFSLLYIISMSLVIYKNGFSFINFYWIITLSYFLLKMILSFFYTPEKKDFVDENATISVFIPVYNEKAELLKETIESLLNQTRSIDNIYLYDDGSNDTSAIDCIEIYKNKLGEKGKKIKIKRCNKNKGKREAQAFWFKKSTSDFFITVDSDCYLHENAVEELLKPFNDPDIYAVTGHVSIRNKVNLLTKLIDIRYENAFRVDRAAQTKTKNILVCSGPLSAYRRNVILDNLEDYISQTFLGLTVSYGDDRRLTNYANRYGKTFYQSTAICETDAPEYILKFLKQQIRWNKSFFRESFVTLKQKNKYFFVNIWVIMELLIWIAYALVFILSIFYNLKVFSVQLMIYSLSVFFINAIMRNVYYFNKNPFIWLLAPLYGILHIVFLFPIRIYSLLTLKDGGWGTR